MLSNMLLAGALGFTLLHGQTLPPKESAKRPLSGPIVFTVSQFVKSTYLCGKPLRSQNI
jgi:hypothetical protein